MRSLPALVYSIGSAVDISGVGEDSDRSDAFSNAGGLCQKFLSTKVFGFPLRAGTITGPPATSVSGMVGLTSSAMSPLSF